MSFLRKFFTLTTCFCLPASISFWLLNLLGHKIHSKSKIGFSILWIKDKLVLEEFAKIGHFNLIRIDNLIIAQRGYIGKFNIIGGPLKIILEETAAIGNGNHIDRGPLGVTYGTATLQLGILTKITANHRLDCTRSITFGNYTTLAGHDSQLWTHAYSHDRNGPGRFRIDGEIIIGNNVYIGSRCIINGGVVIADGVTVGSNASVSKSLVEAGTYVSQALRFITPNDEPRKKFVQVQGFDICEAVYEKKKSNE